MNATILNRDFSHPTDAWYQIEPLGDHLNRAAGVTQVIDPPALDQIVLNFNAEAAAPNFPGMLVDHEHFRHQGDQESRAYGWLQQLQARPDGLYGQIRWSATGKAAVDGGDYRFFSTEYSPTDLVALNDAKPRRVRPTRLAGLTLTNDPNNKGGKPITNRLPTDGDPASQFLPPSSEGSADKPQNHNARMNTVATLLGLSADAAECALEYVYARQHGGQHVSQPPSPGHVEVTDMKVRIGHPIQHQGEVFVHLVRRR